MTRHKPRLMALHCGSQGIGFAIFDGEAIYDWGTVVARDDKNAMCLRKLTRLLDRYSPETLVLEDTNSVAFRAGRIIALHQAISGLCQTRNIACQPYRLAQVQHCLGLNGYATRQDVAEAVARQVDVLAPRLPYPRRPWQSEPRRMAIFSAAAVALTHLSQDRECRR